MVASGKPGCPFAAYFGRNGTSILDIDRVHDASDRRRLITPEIPRVPDPSRSSMISLRTPSPIPQLKLKRGFEPRGGCRKPVKGKIVRSKTPAIPFSMRSLDLFLQSGAPATNRPLI
jgi:hypothetical protein